MTYTIEKRHIPGVVKKAYRNGVGKPRAVVLHDSGNDSATLENELSFMTRNWQNAFAQYWVGDGGRIVELASPDYMAYGAGPKANNFSIHIELAHTKDAATFKKDFAAYIWLAVHLSLKYNIPVRFLEGVPGIITHNWITHNLGGTTHVDPDGYLSRFGISMNDVKKALIAQSKGNKTDVKVSAPKTAVKSATASKKSYYEIAKEVIAGKWGNRTDRESRLKKAGYNPADVQREVNAMYSGASKPQASTKSIKTIANEVIAGKWGNGSERERSLKKAGYNPDTV
jgi:N-acetylmuramoyl-L-alanine amidase